jgi:electron transfer flavoprotein alpha subunit
MVSNCSDLQLVDGEVRVIRPMFGGTYETRVEVCGHPPYVISFQKGVLPSREQSSKSASVVPVPVEIDMAVLRSKILGVVEAAPGEVDITKAGILVSIGRGIGDRSKIPMAKDLAEALGGALSCSRPVADMGWLPFEYQVGISAKTVAPKVYIACGISGASQHVAAMRDSGLIIAINKDPNAPIFGVAHYGVIGNLFDIVPAFIEAAQTSD